MFPRDLYEIVHVIGIAMLFLATFAATIIGLYFVKFVPWLGVLLVLFYFPAIYALFFRSGNAKTCYAVTDRRVLILSPKRSPEEIVGVTEIETDTSGAVRVRDGEGKQHCLTPADAPAFERAILEMASPARSAVVATPDNLGMESFLLDGEQVLWSGEVRSWYLLGTRLRLLYTVVLLGLFLKDCLTGNVRLSQVFLVLTLAISQFFVLLPNEGHYVITNRRMLWICGARRRSLPLTKAPEVWIRNSGVGTMLFPGKRRWQGVPEAEKAAEAISQALAASAPQTATVATEEAQWWLSARR